MSPDPFKGTDTWSVGVSAPPNRFSSSLRRWIPAGLLLVMALICFLLLQADVAFPGLYFWFIGGDLMQFWFIVLVILGFIYWRALPRARQKHDTRRSIPKSDSLMSDLPGNLGSFSAQQTRRASPLLLLRLPLALLLVFLIYYRKASGKAPVIHPGDEPPCLFGGHGGATGLCLQGA